MTRNLDVLCSALRETKIKPALPPAKLHLPRRPPFLYKERLSNQKRKEKTREKKEKPMYQVSS